MEETYDVIVVGAGPAGSSAAAIFGERKKRVLLLDRESFPRDKTCGDGMTFKCMAALERLGIADEFKRQAQVAVKGYSLWFSDDTELTVRRDIGGDAFVHVLPRYVFDHLVLNAALRQATVKFQSETKVRELVRDRSGSIVGVTALYRGEVRSYGAPLVIDASGASSALAVQAGAGNRDPNRCALALRGYYEGVEGLGDTVEFYFDSALQPGYIWIFPTGPRSANVGLGTFQHIVEDRKLDLRKLMQAFIDAHPVAKKKLKGAVLSGAVKGGKIPLAIDHQSSRTRDGFMMIGDAASFTDPITAEGISYAMSSGIFAAEVGAEALDVGDCSARALGAFDTRWKAAFNKQFSRAPILTNVVPKEAFRATLLASFDENPGVAGAVGDVHRQYELMFKLKALMKAL